MSGKTDTRLSGPSTPGSHRINQHGFTLLEMMISITIGLVILAGLVGVLASNAGNARSNERTSELMTNGRYALNAIKSEVREAGFRGFTWAEPGAPGPWVAPADTAGCMGSEAGASVGAFIVNVRQGVWGSNNENPFADSCIPSALYSAGNDVLVVRRLAVTPTAAAQLRANQVYFRSNYERGQVFRGTTGPTFTSPSFTPQDFAVQIYVYYISPFTVSATESPVVPALFRVSLMTDGTMQRELVASGIERMQVQYGRYSTALDTQYLDVLTGASSEATSTAWDDVNSVRIWLLARNSTPEPGYVNSNSYVLGDQVAFVPNDGFRRQLFETVVQLRN